MRIRPTLNEAPVTYCATCPRKRASAQDQAQSMAFPAAVKIRCVPSQSAEVTDLLLAWGRGEQDACDRLMPLVYDELRRLAGRYMRQRAGGSHPAGHRARQRGLPSAGRRGAHSVGKPRSLLRACRPDDAPSPGGLRLAPAGTTSGAAAAHECRSMTRVGRPRRLRVRLRGTRRRSAQAGIHSPTQSPGRGAALLWRLQCRAGG